MEYKTFDQIPQTKEADQTNQLFQDLAPDNSFTEMQSLCMSCGQQGITRLLLTKIPHFKELIIMAFECPHCGWRSNELQSGNEIAEKGQRIEVYICSAQDLNRQVVKSDTATLRIVELDFEIPSQTQKGVLNTVEGYLNLAWEQLSYGQEERRRIDPEMADQLDKFLEQLRQCRDGEKPFTLVLDDPAGNSFIENPQAPKEDPQMKTIFYKRTPQQNQALGLTTEETPIDKALEEIKHEDHFDGKNETMIFKSNCSHCHAPCDTKMLVVDIPHFKDVIIMATTCDVCGFKTNEVKSGGSVSKQGKRITLRVTEEDDISRSILKSETARLKIPELDIDLSTTILGGKFTTIEGLLQDIKNQFQENPFLKGDSSAPERQEKFDKLIQKLDEFSSGKEKFTIILEDPLANSHIQNPFAPDPDPNLIIEDYDRSWEEDEFLGLHDIYTGEENKEGKKETKEEKEEK